ncbi:MAG: hypothetical protein K0R25_503 [Rickettsiaceae bacterium]|nr:hypothetical protein [Rickettsiaceae bacterium]
MTNFVKSAALLAAVFFLNISNCLAWNGYERGGGSEIEISKGTLVREGEDIRFYDWDKAEDRKAEVRAVEYLFNGVRLEVYDFVEKKIRIFEMEL